MVNSLEYPTPRLMEPLSTTSTVFRFELFEADMRAGELRKQGLRIKLQEKPFLLLAMLLERPGEVVTREELRERLWPGDTFVDFDHGINIAINKLREALGDSAESPHFVETLARRGYRFIGKIESPAFSGSQASSLAGRGPASVEPVAKIDKLPHNQPANGQGLHSERAAPSRYSRAGTILTLLFLLAIAGYVGWRIHTPPARAKAGKIILAVLPFENLSGNPEQDYFSDGLTEEMITQLGRLHPERLGVIARTTMMQYRGTKKSTAEIGRELGADYILEGSVRRADGRVRITAQLIQVSDQTHVWADSYERNLSDVLTLQSEVASAIAERIQLQLTPAQRERLASAQAVNPEAYEDYLKGRFYWNERTGEGFEKAIVKFNAAIAEDPNYAPPYAGLADTYNLLGSVPANVLPPRVAMSKARDAASRALALDESLAEAHVSLGYVKMAYEWDFPAAEAEYKRAIELNPAYPTAHQWYAFYLTAMGRARDADTENMIARQLDPLSIPVNAQIAWSDYIARRFDDAIAQSQRLIELEPNHYISHLYLGLGFEGKKLYPQAIKEFQKADLLSGGSPIVLGALGHTYAVSGEKTKALELIRRLEGISKQRYVPGLYPAAIYAGLDDKENAIRWLTRAVEDRTDYCMFLPLEPEAENLRSDLRFKELIRRIGLPQGSN